MRVVKLKLLDEITVVLTTNYVTVYTTRSPC